jgi:hypothetical protein
MNIYGPAADGPMIQFDLFVPGKPSIRPFPPSRD